MADEAFRVFIALHLVDRASSHLMAFSKLAGQAGQGVDVINKKLAIMGGLASMAIGVAAVGSLVHLGSESIKAANELEKVKLQLLGIGFTGNQVANAVKQVQGLSGIHPALGNADLLAAYKDVHTALGSIPETQRMMPEMAKFMLAMKGQYGEASEKNVYSAMRAGELALGKDFNSSKMMQYLDIFTKMAEATGGRVDPNQVFNFMKNIPYSRISQTPEAVLKETMAMVEMGGGRAGTAFQALDRFLLGHTFQVANKHKAEFWAKMGLIDVTARNNKGSITDFRVHDQDLYVKDKVQWLITDFLGAFKKKGIDITNPANIGEMLKMFSAQTVGQAIVPLMLQLPRFQKELALLHHAQGYDAAAKSYENSPIGHQEAFMAAGKNFLTALGEALLPLLTKTLNALTPIIQGLTKFMQQHPDITRTIYVMSLIGGACLIVGGAIAVLVGLIGTAWIPAVLGVTAAITAVSGVLITFLSNIKQRLSLTLDSISIIWHSFLVGFYNSIAAIANFIGGGKETGFGWSLHHLATLDQAQINQKWNKWEHPAVSPKQEINIHIAAQHFNVKDGKDAAKQWMEEMKSFTLNPKQSFTSFGSPSLRTAY